MQAHFGAEVLRAEWESCVTCIGTFDGVHLGHQAVIREAVRQARAKEQPCVLVTFDRHPMAVLNPDKRPPAIASLARNLAQFESLGVAVSVVLRFDEELSRTSAACFFERVLRSSIKAGSIVIGRDFAFGLNREGTPEWIAERLPTIVVPPLEMGGRVSSTAIRLAVADGRVEEAARWLGRPFAVEGVVVQGKKLGRRLGFPTVNVARSFDQVMPADGVYAGICTTDGGRFKAAVSVGIGPAAGGGPRIVEAYLLDYDGPDLYGAAVCVELHERLRGEQDFASLESLAEQIAADVQRVRSVLTA